MSAGEADFGVEISRGLVAKFLMAAVGFAGSVVFARVLGPGGYGAFYLVQTLVSVLDNPATGWGAACKKRVSEAGFPASEALGSALAAAVVVPLVVVPAVYLFQRFTGVFDLSGLLLPFAALFGAMCLFVVTSQVLSARANFSAAEWADTLRSLLTTPLQLALVLAGFGVTGMVYGLAAATALTVPYVLYRVGVRPAVPSRRTLASIGSYAKFSVPNGFLGTAKSRVDILLLGALVSSAAVADYQVSMQLTMAGAFVGTASSAGLMARVSDYRSRGDSEAIVEDVTNALGYASVLSVPIFFGAAAMPGDLLVTVFGPQYAGVGPVLVGLSLFRALNAQSRQLESAISGLDRPDVNTRVGALALVSNVALGYVLLLEYGVLGVVAATVVSEVVQYGALAYAVKRQLPDVPLFSRPLRHQLLAGASMFVVVDRLHAAVGVSWWGELAALVGVGGAVYFAVLAAVSRPFRVTVRGILADLRAA